MQRAAASAAAVLRGCDEEALHRSSCDSISGAERGECTFCAACPGFEIWYRSRDASDPEVMFFCSRCGCEAALHTVSVQWAAQDAARRAAEAATRQRAQRAAEAGAAAAQRNAAGARAQHLAALGLRSDATDKQAAAAYRRLALKWHPDKHATRDAASQAAAAARFCRLTDAFRGLSIT